MLEATGRCDVDRKSPRYAQPGLSLIELVAALAVLAVLLAAAVPRLQLLLHNGITRTETARLLSALQLARGEAVRRNRPVSLCPSPAAAGGEPACAGSYSGGWMVFANPGRDGRFDEATDELIRLYHALPRRYRLTNRGGDREAAELITYLPDGSARRALTLMLCSPLWPRVSSSSVVLNRVGRPRIAMDWGACAP